MPKTDHFGATVCHWLYNVGQKNKFNTHVTAHVNIYEFSCYRILVWNFGLVSPSPCLFAIRPCRKRHYAATCTPRSPWQLAPKPVRGLPSWISISSLLTSSSRFFRFGLMMDRLNISIIVIPIRGIYVYICVYIYNIYRLIFLYMWWIWWFCFSIKHLHEVTYINHRGHSFALTMCRLPCRKGLWPRPSLARPRHWSRSRWNPNLQSRVRIRSHIIHVDVAYMHPWTQFFVCFDAVEPEPGPAVNFHLGWSPKKAPHKSQNLS